MRKLLHFGLMLCGLLLSMSAYAIPDWFHHGGATIKIHQQGEESFIDDPSWVNEVIVVETSDQAEEAWSTQLFITFPVPLELGDKVTLSMKVKADHEKKYCNASFHAEPGEYVTWGIFDSFDFTTEWTTVERSVVITDKHILGDRKPQTICFDLAEPKNGNTFYFDEVKADVDKGLLADSWYRNANYTLKVGTLNGKDYVLTDPIPKYDNQEDENIDGYFSIDVNSNASSQDEKMLFITLPEPLEVDDSIKVRMRVRSEQIVPNVLVQSYNASYECIGTGFWDYNLSFEDCWIEIDKELRVTPEMVSQTDHTMQVLGFSLAEIKGPDNCIYIDDVYVETKKYKWQNIITNSDMEDFDQMDNFLMKIDDERGYEPATNQKGSAFVPAKASVNRWDTRFIIHLPFDIPKGVDYRLSFKRVASEPVIVDVEAFEDFNKPNSSWNGLMISQLSFSNQVWETYKEVNTTSSMHSGQNNTGLRNIVFDLAQYNQDVDFMFDDVVFEIEEELVGPLKIRTALAETITEAKKAIQDGKLQPGDATLAELETYIRDGESFLADKDYMNSWRYLWPTEAIKNLLARLDQQPQPQPGPTDEFTAGTPDDWYTNANFTIKADDTPNGGTRRFVEEPRWVKDPLDKVLDNNVIVVTEPEDAMNTWDCGIFITAPAELADGDKVTLRMKVRSERPRNDVQLHLQGQIGEWRHVFFNEPVIFTTQWRTHEFTTEITSEMLNLGSAQTLALMLADDDGESNNFFFDDVELIVTKAPTTVNEAKFQLEDLINRASALNKKYKIERLKKALAEAIKAARYNMKCTDIIDFKPYRNIITILEKAALELKRFADTNTDGNVSITDAIALLKHIVDKDPEGFSLLGADVNGDGKFTITDAIAILKLILNEDGSASAPARPDMDEVDNGFMPQ